MWNVALCKMCQVTPLCEMWHKYAICCDYCVTSYVENDAMCCDVRCGDVSDVKSRCGGVVVCGRVVEWLWMWNGVRRRLCDVEYVVL